MQQLKNFYHHYPIRFIVLLALVIRILAAIFAKGYMAHDDHFLIIETAAGWVHDFDDQAWLPENYPKGDVPVPGHNFFYTGIHYLLFSFFDLIGLVDPQWAMFVIRLLHAVFGVLVVSIGCKITLALANKKTATQVGWVLALFGILPVFGVRNMAEAVCIPPLMAGAFWLIKNNISPKKKYILGAGLMLGIAVGLRYQVVLMAAPFGFVLLLKKKWLDAIILGVVAIATFFLTQISDLFVWGEPFRELFQYIEYNRTEGANSINFPTGPWYNYFLTICGFVVPPIGLFLLFGFARSWKKHLLIWLPVVVFFAFHSYFPNKQERFILPMLPFFFIIGMIGWNEFVSGSVFWSNRKKLLKGFWTFFWVCNSLILFAFTLSYTKKSRVEATYYLYQQDDFERYAFDNSVGREVQIPMFYSGKWHDRMVIRNAEQRKNFKGSFSYLGEMPNYVIFAGDEQLEQRISDLSTSLSPLEFKAKIEPGNLDKLLNWLNPNNRLEEYFIYRVAREKE